MRKKYFTKSKKVICVALTVMMLGSGIPFKLFSNENEEKVYAEEYESIVGEDTYKYEILNDGTVAIIGYIGKATNLVIPGKLDGKKVTKLAEGVFKYNVDLRGVTISEGITDIGNSTFWGCKNLKDMILPQTLEVINSYSFFGCESLENINISKNVNTIAINAFYECNNLKNICVSEENKKYKSVEGVLYNKEGSRLLNYPPKKEGTEFTVPVGVESISNQAFYKCNKLVRIYISEEVKYIEDEAFYECSNLKDINIPNGVTEIGKRSFYKCSNLQEIVIPSSVIKIGDSAFYECSNLSSLKLSEGIKYIDAQSFMYCDNLSLVNIPISVAEIGRNAFASCKNLLSINVEEGNNAYKSIDGVLFNRKGDLLIRYPSGKKDKEYIIPFGVTHISEWAFDKSSNLKKVDMPETVSNIGNTAFCDCDSLEEINIPLEVTSIEASTFIGCKNLASIYLHEAITNISAFAFSQCSSLEKIDVSDKNMNYSSYEGVLFNKTGDTLVVYPAGKSDTCYVIPEKVTKLEYGAFLFCNNLTTLVMPKNLEKINALSINECKHLTEVIVCDGIVKIDYEAQIGDFIFTSIKLPDSVKEISDKTIGYYSYYDDNYEEQFVKIDEFVVYGYSGTQADLYAKKNGLKFVPLVSVTDEKSNISAEYCVVREEDIVSIQVNEYIKGEEFYDNLNLEEKLVDTSLLTDEVNFKVFDLNFVDENINEVKIEGRLWIKIPCPDNFNCEESKVYLIDEKGIVSDMEAVYEDKYLMFKSNNYGTYVISEKELITAPSYISGDSNNDGKIDTQDAVLIKKYLAGYTDVEINEDAGDVNSDGIVSSADAVMVLKHLAGYEGILD